jgi:ABC-type glutathione transport system ATPase component
MMKKDVFFIPGVVLKPMNAVRLRPAQGKRLGLRSGVIMLEAVKLGKQFTRGFFKKVVFQVRDISFQLNRGEILGLVGPSGSGKSTIGRMMVGLTRPTNGVVRLDGKKIFPLSGKRLHHQHKVQIVFQEPHLTLDPKQTVSESLQEVLLAHKLVPSRKAANQRVMELFDQTGLTSEILNRLPREISGGQAQRVVIARALCLLPQYLIADEPTSMLDLSVQAMILRLLQDFKLRRNLGILFISHDPAVIQVICDRVIFLQNGSLLPP